MKSEKIDLQFLACNKKKILKIYIENLNTQECRYYERYKKYTISNDETAQPHTGRVIDVSELENAGMSFEYKEEGEPQLCIPISYPYQYVEEEKEDYARFLINYLFLEVRPLLKINLPIITCRYRKLLEFSIAPDLCWAFHFQFGDLANRGKTFYRNMEVKLKRGLREEIEKFHNYNDKIEEEFKKIIPEPFWILFKIYSFNHRLLLDFVLMYYQAIAEDFALGLHALYNIESNEKYQCLDYFNKYQLIPLYIIHQLTCASISLDLLLLFLTRGKNLPATLAKIQKINKIIKTTRSFLGVSKQALRHKDITIISPQIGMYVGKGFQEDEDGQQSFMLECRFMAAPFLGVEYDYKWTIGEFFSSITGLSSFFDKSRSILGIAGQIKSLKGPLASVARKAGLLQPKSGGKLGISPQMSDYVDVIDAMEDCMVASIDEIVKEKLGVEASLNIFFSGHYDADVHLKFNLFKNKFSYSDFLAGVENVILDSNSQAVYSAGQGIDALVTIQASTQMTVKWSRLNYYIPKVVQDFVGQEFVDTTTSAEVSGEIRGALYFERIFECRLSTIAAVSIPNLVNPKDVKMPTYRDNIIFTGLYGSIMVLVEVEVQEKVRWDVSVGNKNEETGELEEKMFRIIPAFTILGKEQPIFPNIT